MSHFLPGSSSESCFFHRGVSQTLTKSASPTSATALGACQLSLLPCRLDFAKTVVQILHECRSRCRTVALVAVCCCNFRDCKGPRFLSVGNAFCQLCLSAEHDSITMDLWAPGPRSRTCLADEGSPKEVPGLFLPSRGGEETVWARGLKVDVGSCAGLQGETLQDSSCLSKPGGTAQNSSGCSVSFVGGWGVG